MTHALGLQDIEGLGGTEVWKGGCVQHDDEILKCGDLEGYTVHV